MTFPEFSKEVERAFGSQTCPPRQEVVPDGDRTVTANWMRHFWVGKHWRELTPEELGNNLEPMADMTARAFLFYLPAYMLVALTGADLDLIPESLIFRLTPKPALDTDDLFRERFSKLTHDQKQVIRHFLELLSHRFPQFSQDIDLARSLYWDEAALP